MLKEVDKSKLTPGKFYKITLGDCCIEGEIYGTFIRWEEDNAHFDIGIIGPNWGKWFPEEINNHSKVLTVSNCVRCGRSHEVEFMQYNNSPVYYNSQKISHWGMCPNLKEPILMYIRKTDE